MHQIFTTKPQANLKIMLINSIQISQFLYFSEQSKQPHHRKKTTKHGKKVTSCHEYANNMILLLPL